jgi:FkbM family methyltransferase
LTFRSYAQNFEDIILWRALKHVKNGFYIDIGAWDPVSDSVSLAFYEQGWRGIHVEPLPYYAARLREARPDELVIEAAISDRPGDVTFFEIEGTGLSTGVEAHALRHRQWGYACQETSVPSRTLASIFDEVGHREIHWLKIDVEGMEREVLSSWGASKARPWLLAIESTLPNLPTESFESWEPLVLQRGYEFVYFDGLNRYYVHESHAGLLTGKIAESEERTAVLMSALDRIEAKTVEAASRSQEGLKADIGDVTAKVAETTQRLGQLEVALKALEAAQTQSAQHLKATQDLEAALKQKETALADLDQRHSEAIEARARLAGALEERSAALTDLRSQLDAGTGERLQLKAAVTSLEAALAERTRLLGETEERLTKLAAERDQIANDLCGKLAQRESEIADLRRTKVEAERWGQSASDSEIALKQHVRALEAQFQEVVASTSWRLTAPVRLVGRFARWLAVGARAWLTLRNGSRPHRIYTALKSRALAPFRGRRLSAATFIGKALAVTQEGIDLEAEPRDVRVLYSRLIHARDRAHIQPSAKVEARPRLAYFSPLPPQRSGISDYSAELLPELAKHYAIDVIVTEPSVSDAWIATNCAIRSIEWFEENAYSFDRILYHVGNSRFHHHMFPLLERFPGIVVLHDFYLGHLLAFLELEGSWHGYWTRALLHSHGYAAVEKRLKSADPSETILTFPANLALLQQAQGVIVHSEHARQLAKQHYGEAFGSDWIVVPHCRRLPKNPDRVGARRALGISDNEFLVCSFGVMGPEKLNHRLLSAWLKSNLAEQQNCRLVFVGELQPNQYCSDLRRDIGRLELGGRVHIGGFVSPESYKLHLQAADLAVQMRTRSRGETSGAVLDCMAHSLPTIVNANGSAAELPQDCILMLPDAFSDDELALTLNRLWKNSSLRSELGRKASTYVRAHRSPRNIADQYKAAIERIASHRTFPLDTREFAAHVNAIKSDMLTEADWLQHARQIAPTSRRKRLRKLYVDVTALARVDLKTGIQRVVKSLVLELLANPPEHFQIEPILARRNPSRWDYHHASGFVAQLLSMPAEALDEDPVEFGQGDIFFGADLHTDGVTAVASEGLYERWRRAGVSINFHVHDLLPVKLPQYFPAGEPENFRKWLSVVTENADGLICTTEATAAELKHWIASQASLGSRRPQILTCPLGADFKPQISSRGVPADAASILDAISSQHSFLMVGTVEPRKGYDQALRAFEILWGEGADVCLAIVGKQGWMTEDLARRLKEHPQLGRRLFWLESISDEYLEKLYEACRCLIAASEGEGFGLPLIEAARHGLPIIARDIPVFREVSGNHATFFGGSDAGDLARAVASWLELYADDRHPKSQGMQWLTWAESIERLKTALVRDQAELPGKSPLTAGMQAGPCHAMAELAAKPSEE